MMIVSLLGVRVLLSLLSMVSLRFITPLIKQNKNNLIIKFILNTK